jgi:hypothetical protein
MVEYRVYRLGRDGHIVSGEFLVAEDDDAAVERVRNRRERMFCELWSGSRQVAVIPPTFDPTSAADAHFERIAG